MNIRFRPARAPIPIVTLLLMIGSAVPGFAREALLIKNGLVMTMSPADEAPFTGYNLERVYVGGELLAENRKALQQDFPKASFELATRVRKLNPPTALR